MTKKRATTGKPRKALKVKKETIQDLEVPPRRAKGVKGGLIARAPVNRGCCSQATDCWSKMATAA